jgi:hypothetical protein
MKNRIAFGSVLALAVFSLVSAHAQTSVVIRADIPFEWVAGDITLPAGTYTIGPGGLNPAFVVIRHVSGVPCILTVTGRVQGPHLKTRDVLQFARYGDKYFLRQVWTSNTDIGRKFHQSTLEKELLALGVASPSVELAAQRQ